MSEIFSQSPHNCPEGPHRGPEGPCEDLSVCSLCGSPSYALRPTNETYGQHAYDCALSGQHYGLCASTAQSRLTHSAENPSHAPADLERGWPTSKPYAAPRQLDQTRTFLAKNTQDTEELIAMINASGDIPQYMIDIVSKHTLTSQESVRAAIAELEDYYRQVTDHPASNIQWLTVLEILNYKTFRQ